MYQYFKKSTQFIKQKTDICTKS